MTKQTINLIGGVVVGAIVVLGLLFGVLPRWSAMRTADQDRQTVAMQNQSQQTVNTVLAAQRAKLPALQAEVAVLEQQIPAGPHLEQLIQVAGSLPAGAVLRSITPAGAGTAGATAGATPTPAPSTGDGFTALPVTLVIDLRRPSDAATVLDRLRAGPRLLAIDEASVSQSGTDRKAADYALTVTGRVFATPAADAPTTAGGTP